MSKEKRRVCNYLLLKYYRIQHGYTQQEVAERIGASRPVYVQIENGGREPKLRHLYDLTVLYNTTMQELCSDPDEFDCEHKLEFHPEYNTDKDEIYLQCIICEEKQVYKRVPLEEDNQ